MPQKQPTITPLPTHPSLVLTLDLIDTTPARFHWALFVPSPTDSEIDDHACRGTRFHAIGDQTITAGWAYDRVESYALGEFVGLAAAAVIGSLKDGRTVDDLHVLLRDIPMTVPDVDVEHESKWTCRVWAREALRRMHKVGIVACIDVDALEEEMWVYGRHAAETIEKGKWEGAQLVWARHSK
ncbi:hypothetical protein EW146_g2476 [Bondarzewia mesenterica]|uniref:Uncharacterized protein n=1 Tax=Bondarzewia mesenterica TaxID=1095465 RepID=A0A4S4M2G5_9AGAM|nr:hypothetical protein EW146_g2476 [Bondarzewia mesenterica]